MSTHMPRSSHSTGQVSGWRFMTWLTTLVAVIVTAVPALAATDEMVASAIPPGLTRLTGLAASALEPIDGVVTFDGNRPSAEQLGALEALGLQVQALEHLPLALVRGTLAQLEAAVSSGVAADVYPNEELEYYSAESTAAMGVDQLRADGLTGKGVGVAIVDSGIDATHPDLADHVTHNLKVVSQETLGLVPDAPAFTVVVPVDELPYDNSDFGVGHGTHVAGIVGADGHTSPDQVGVAPDAELVGYAMGDILNTFGVLAAFDHLLGHHEEWNIDVVNNSWGGTYNVFDPDDPVNVATKALADAGLVVVFAAGNVGDEMTLNSFSAAPWVISVGSATTGSERSDFSSGGIEFDNSTVTQVSGNSHFTFTGDGLGLYHPDVSAPGSNITSSGTPTGLMVLPAAPGGTRTLSGTSMAAPQVAGAAALVLQARPDLSPDQVREVLQVTAAPMADGSSFWQSGYGFVDVAAAVDLVRRPDFGPELLGRLQEEADARVRQERGYSVLTMDLWEFPVPTGASNVQRFETEVTPQTQAIKAVAFVPPVAVPQEGVVEYRLTVIDAQGQVVAQTSSMNPGTSSLFVDLASRRGGDAGGAELAYGTWQITVEEVVVGSPGTNAVPVELGGQNDRPAAVAVTQLSK